MSVTRLSQLRRLLCLVHVVISIAVLGGAASAAGLLPQIQDASPLSPVNQVAQKVPVIEEESCDDPAGTAKTTIPARAPGTMVVTFTVPAVAFVRLAADGSIEAVGTNTGCAPRGDEQWLSEQADGTWLPVPTPPVADRQWVGNFLTAGVLQPQ